MNTDPDAWLEFPDGERIALEGNCSLGRSPSNTVPIGSDMASRRHATIHAQNGGEFWLVDLGSSNGTHLNGRRVAQPVRLSDGDVITIAEKRLVFHQEAAPAAAESSAEKLTMVEIRNMPCWLLIADLEDFTTLSQRVPADELAGIVGRWVRACREVIEQRGGTINKYLGDGFLAFWDARNSAPAQVAETIGALQELQRTSDAPFRIVVHHGRVASGGTATRGEDNLSGPEVNLTFRLEKLAGGLGVPLCLSENAARELGDLIQAEKVQGEHDLKGFTGTHRVFRLTGLSGG